MPTPSAEPAGPPEMPSGTITLQPPPDKVEAQLTGNILSTFIPMLGSMGMMVVMALSSANPRMLMTSGGMAFAMLGMAGFNIYRQVRGHVNQIDTTRREYLAYLAETRETVRTVARRQRRFNSWHMPDPEALVFIAEDRKRVWERAAGSPGLLMARLGVTTQDLAMTLEDPELAPLAVPDAVCYSAMSRFVDVHRRVDQVPFGVPLGRFARVEIIGQEEDSLTELRAIVAGLATMAAPDLLQIAVLCSESRRPHWEWLKWLPHAASGQASDAIGPERMVVSSYEDFARVVGSEVLERAEFAPRGTATPTPHVLVIVDGGTWPPEASPFFLEGAAGVTVVSMPQRFGAVTAPDLLRIVVHPAVSGSDRHVLEVVTLETAALKGTADALSVVQAEAIARRLARPPEEATVETEEATAEAGDPKRAADLSDLLRIGDLRDFDPERQWTFREGRDRLRVPFAVTPTGVPVHIDIKESAQGGMGPHGLLIGATGSGKSEVLRTMVLALALTHSPEQLNLVLVDFKGGATFAGMASMPHVSAMISNLESEGSLVDRMQDALRGEMTRRQEVLRKYGNYANVSDYEADRRSGKHQGPPLPALFLILDEFSELLSANPDFIDTFVAIGRLGRSMSIHLLLSSQRLEEGRLRGLDSHLSYRVGLRTFSAQESRSVLGVTDAYDLPSIPGVGYLKTGSAANMVRFRASYVAAPPPPRRGGARLVASADGISLPPAARIIPFTTAPQTIEEPPEPETPAVDETPVDPATDPWAGMTQLDIAVAKMEGKGIPAHQVWLPPLDVPDTFVSLMPDLAVDPQLGWISHAWRDSGWLRVPLGIVDVPLEQRREPLVFDLSGAGGNLAVIGGPLTGKSTVLRSLVMALSLTHTPLEVQFYVIDFGGGTFAPFAGAAHVAGVATRDQPDVINRILAEIEGIMADREIYFREHNIDSISTYRQARAQGRLDEDGRSGDGYGDIFLVVDGWTTLRTDFDEVETRIMGWAARALTFGVHLVTATGRWMDLRQALRDIMGSRFELRLGDPGDSEIDRKIAARIPQNRPGRGLEIRKLHALTALPRADVPPAPENTDTLADGVPATLRQIAQSWTGPAGPKLRLLPIQISLNEIRALEPDSPNLLIGVEETRLGPLPMDPRKEAHLYLFGDSRSGKSSFLRAIAREVIRLNTPKEAQIIAVDLRRALLGEIPAEYLMRYSTTREDADATLGGLVDYLRKRLPGPDVTPEQLRNRSWWTGAECWVLVDDYDLVATSSGNPVAALQPLMAQALDVGLHIIVTRRSGGASRALYDPVIQTMNELGSTGILLAGNPDEGALIGRCKPMRVNPGRAQVVTREQGRLMAQLAWVEPTT